MAVDSSEECHSFHTVMILPGGTTNLQSDPNMNMAFTQAPNVLKSEMCEPNLLHGIKHKVDKVKNYVQHITDTDIEKGNPENPKSTEECFPILNIEEGSKERQLFGDFCVQIGSKLMQLLMKHAIELPKFISRDAPTNRSRKYKRSSSFNSRRVVLLSSALSILGTIILIYLTLRVRQFGDASAIA